MNSSIFNMKWTLYAATALSSLSIPVHEVLASDPTNQEQSASLFNNIGKWEFIEHIDGSGGGTGVHVFLDPKSQKKFTVKDATHQNHLIEELTAKALYRAAGFNAPEFTVLDRTSNLWPKAWKDRFPNTPRLLLSQFIEAGPEDQGKKKEKLKRWIDILLGNFDLAGHNYIVDPEGEIYPIDFGGSLRLRANGEIKLHEMLWGYFWPKDADTESPSPEEIAKLRASLPRLFETLLDLHHQISIPDFPSLWNILASRTHSFLNKFDPKPLHFMGDRPSIEGKMCGGVLFVTDIDGIPHALLAKRHNNSWSDLGGGAKVTDRTVNRTAWREAIEEMGGFIPLDYAELLSSPYLEHEGEVLYRMFIHKVSSIDIEQLTKHVKSKDNPYTVEHEEFTLVPLDTLAQDDRLYAPMRALLSTAHAQTMLKAAGQGLKWSPVKGQSPFLGQARLGDYVFETLKLDLLPEKAFRAKARAVIELRTKFKPSGQKGLISSQLYTQTRGCLKAHLKDTYVEGDEASNLTNLLVSKSSRFMGRPDELAERLPFIQRIIGLEDQYPEHQVYYHGGLGHYGLLWAVATALRDELFLAEGTSVRTLRLYENAFEGMDSCRTHLEALGQDNDYSPGGQARMLSTNMSLVGSIGRGSSETLKYFFSNTCMDSPDQPKEILKKYLEVALQLPQMAVNQFLKELGPHFTSLENVGALFQLFIPENLAERFTYLSFPGGSRVLFKGQDKTALNSTVGFIKLLKQDPEAATSLQLYKEYSDDKHEWINFQGRVELHPEMLYDEQVHSQIYFSDERSVDAILNVVRNAVNRFIIPHLHLASSHQAYTTPPRLVQLHKVITGTARDEVDPRLQELLDLSQDWEKNADQIMTKLEDPNIARLEKVDALSLKRIRALELSPMLAPLSDHLTAKSVGMNAVEWTAELAAVKDKYSRILTYVEQQGLKTDRQKVNDMAKLLVVEPNDPNFERLKHILSCPYTQKLLRVSPGAQFGDIKDDLGKIVQRLHDWGKRRGSTLRWLEKAGFLVYGKQGAYDSGSSSDSDDQDSKTEKDEAINNSQIVEIDPTIHTNTLRDILKMFVKERFPFVRCNYLGDFYLINEVAKQGIEASRTALREIVTDLEIQEPIEFASAEVLLETRKELGGRWKEICSHYVRIIKPHISQGKGAWEPQGMVIDEALDLLVEHGPEKVEAALKEYVRVLKPYVSKETSVGERVDIIWVLELFTEHESNKIEAATKILVEEGYLKVNNDKTNDADSKNSDDSEDQESSSEESSQGYDIFGALDILCSMPNPELSVSRVRALSLGDRSLHSLTVAMNAENLEILERAHSILYGPRNLKFRENHLDNLLQHLKKLSPVEQERLLGILAQPRVKLLNEDDVTRKLQTLNEFKDRPDDIEQLLPAIEEACEDSWKWQSALTWSMRQDPANIDAIKLLLRAGFEDCPKYTKALKIVVANFEFIRDHPEVLLPFDDNSSDKYCKRLTRILNNYQMAHDHWEWVTSDVGMKFLRFLDKHKPSSASVKAMVKYLNTAKELRVNGVFRFPSAVNSTDKLPLEFEHIVNSLFKVRYVHDLINADTFYIALSKLGEEVDHSQAANALTAEEKIAIYTTAIELFEHSGDLGQYGWLSCLDYAGHVAQHDPTALTVVKETAARYEGKHASSKNYERGNIKSIVYVLPEKIPSSLKAVRLLNQFPKLKLDDWFYCYEFMRDLKNPDLFEPVFREWIVPMHESGDKNFEDTTRFTGENETVLNFRTDFDRMRELIKNADLTLNNEQKVDLLLRTAQMIEGLDKMDLKPWSNNFERFRSFKKKFEELWSQ